MQNDVQILKNAGYLTVVIVTTIPYFIYSIQAKFSGCYEETYYSTKPKQLEGVRVMVFNVTFNDISFIHIVVVRFIGGGNIEYPEKISDRIVQFCNKSNTVDATSGPGTA